MLKGPKVCCVGGLLHNGNQRIGCLKAALDDLWTELELDIGQKLPNHMLYDALRQITD